MNTEQNVKVALLMKNESFKKDLLKTAASLKLNTRGVAEVIHRTASAMNLNNIVKQAGMDTAVMNGLRSAGQAAPAAVESAGSAIPSLFSKAKGALTGQAAKGVGIAGLSGLLGNSMGQQQGANSAMQGMGDEAMRVGGGALGGGALGAGLGSMVDSPIMGGLLGAGAGGVAGHYSPEILKALGLQ